MMLKSIIPIKKDGSILGLAAIFLFFTITLAPHSVTAAKLGDPCAANPTTLCDDANTFLVCDEPNDRCICQNGANSYFDQLDGKCHIYHSGLCLDDAPTHQPCPVNGYCQVFEDPNDCRCVAGFTQTPTNKCAKNYQEPCTDHPKCDRDAFMQCLHQICQCDDLTSRYESNVCRLKATQSCVDTSQQCTQWSTCKEETPSGGDFKCLCDDGLLDNGQGVCQAKIGETCATDGSRDCLDSGFITCDPGSGECMCDPLTSHADSKNTVCYLDNGASCRTGADDQPCDLENFFKCDGTTCGCATTVDANGVCVLDHDSPCQPGPDQQPCDGSKYLTCGSGGKCDCGANAEWDGTKSMCILKNGATCVGNLPTDQPCHVENFVTCAGTVCQCDDSIGAHFDSTGVTCVLGHDSICSLAAGAQPCDSEAFLSCDNAVNGKCACDAMGHWDATEGHCMLDNGATCEDASGNSLGPCDPDKYLTCDDISKTCGCDAATSILDPSSGACFLTHGSACSHDADTQLCDGAKYLTCGPENTCDCGANADWDGTKSMCILKNGATCVGNSPTDQPCHVENFVTCAGTVCQCDDSIGAHFDSTGVTCVLGHDSICSLAAGAQPCDSEAFLSCDNAVNGKCACDAMGHWDATEGHCVLDNGATCEDAGGTSLGPCDPDKYLTCDDITKTCGCDAATSILDPGTGTCFLTHGSACSQDADQQPCDSTKYLSCGPENTCDCGANAEWDNSKTACILKAGSTCTVGAQSCHVENFVDCRGGVCKCDETIGADFDSTGTKCVLQLAASCVPGPNIPPCDPDKFLSCEGQGTPGDEKCACGLTSSYDSGIQKCAINMGGDCTHDPAKEPCNPSQFLICGADDTCGCADDAGVDPVSGLCVLGFGAACVSGLQPCNDGLLLECLIGGTCGCAVTKHRVFDEYTGKCAWSVGATCTPPALEDCVTNSVCTTGQCVCSVAEGFDETTDHRCLRPYGAGCALDHEDYCNHDALQVCDRLKCACLNPNEMIYDEPTQRCYVSLHHSCSTSEPCAPRELVCSANGECVCNKDGGYVNEQNGKCLKTFDSFCDLNDGNGGSCDFASHVECINEKCRCATNYDPYGENCLGTFNASCVIPGDCNNFAALTCQSGSCNCVATDQNYDLTDEICYGKIGAQCNLTINDEHPLLCQPGLRCRGSVEVDKVGRCSSATRSFLANWYTYSLAILGLFVVKKQIYVQ